MTLTSGTTISRREARRIALHSNGLGVKRPFGKGKSAVFNALDQLGYVQIDTISVVQRAHHHVLWSRVPGYQSRYLHDLQPKDRLVFEYWAHAAAYLPMEDYRYALPIMRYFREHKDPWRKSERKIMNHVLERIAAEGPLMSRDFEVIKKKKGGGWWDWKPTKIALQRLFFEGHLMTSERRGFQRVYDLPERVIPEHIDQSEPTEEDYARHLIRRGVRAYGLIRPGEISYLRAGLGAVVRQEVAALAAEGELVRVHVRGIDEPYYCRPETLNTTVRINNSVRILSPFDNVAIQRKRLSDLFDFDYQIECYVPREKRTYGYFTLPMLFGDQFVGRLDSKADRKTGILHLFNLHFEEKFLKKIPRVALRKSVIEFMQFNNCQAIQLHRTNSSVISQALFT